MFNDAQHTLIGEKTRRVYRLADSVRVTIARVDLDARRIDFAIAGDSQQPRKVSIRDRLRSGDASKGRSAKPSGESRQRKKGR